MSDKAPANQYPMRAVVGRRFDSHNRPLDVLECGHVKPMGYHILEGERRYETYAQRRCVECEPRARSAAPARSRSA